MACADPVRRRLEGAGQNDPFEPARVDHRRRGASGFHGTLAGVVFDVWMPVTMATAMGTGNGTLHYRGRATKLPRLCAEAGVTVEQARAEVAALGRRLAATYRAPTGASTSR